MKIGVSLSRELVDFADEEADHRGTTRSGLLAELLQEVRVRKQALAYLDRHGWDVAEDSQGWREHQRQRMAAQYADDEW